MLLFSALKSSISFPRSSYGVLPSNRRYSCPRNSKKSSKISSMITNWEKRTTREPCSFSFIKSLSKTIILPQQLIKCSSVVKGGPGSTFSIKYGWFATFRSSITILLMAFIDSSPIAFTFVSSLTRTFLYNSRCISESPTNSFNSIFGNSDFSTSALIRRNMNGRRMSRNRSATLLFPRKQSSESNHVSKSSALANTSGSRKFNSAHSSCKLF